MIYSKLLVIIILSLSFSGCALSLFTSNTNHYYRNKNSACSQEELQRCENFHISKQNCDCEETQ